MVWCVWFSIGCCVGVALTLFLMAMMLAAKNADRKE